MTQRTDPKVISWVTAALALAMSSAMAHADCDQLPAAKPSHPTEKSLSFPSQTAENEFRKTLDEQAGLDLGEARLFFDCLKIATKRDDRHALSRLIRYPLRVNTAKGANIIRTPAAFMKAYPMIFNPRVKAAIDAQRFEDVFVSYRGIMIGNGEVWISGISERGRSKPTIKIISINNQ